MDPYSIVLEALTRILDTQTLAVSVVAGYWIFFLSFYRMEHWGKNRLEWADRLLISLPLGILYTLFCWLPVFVAYLIADQLQILYDARFAWASFTVFSLACLSIHRWGVDAPLASEKALKIAREEHMTGISLLFWAYFPTIPLVIFGWGLGYANPYLSASSREFWSVVLPSAYMISVFFLQILFSSIIVGLPLVVNKKLSDLRLDSWYSELLIPSAWIFRRARIAVREKLRPNARRTIAAAYLALIPIVVLISDSFFVMVTPQVACVEVMRIDLRGNIVTRRPQANESYLVPMRAAYNIVMPKIPLANITIINPCNSSTHIGDTLTRKTISMKSNVDVSHSRLFDKTLGNSKIEIEPRWSINETVKITLEFFQTCAHSQVVHVLNETELEPDKEYEYVFKIENSEEDPLILEDYWLIYLRFPVSNLTAHLDGRNVDGYLKPDGWLVITGLRIYGKGSRLLTIKLRYLR